MADPADSSPETNKNVIFLVILTLAICTVVGISTFSYCTVFKVTPDPTLVQALGQLTGICLGYLAGVLSKTTPTQTTKTVTVSDQPTITDADPNKPKP